MAKLPDSPFIVRAARLVAEQDAHSIRQQAAAGAARTLAQAAGERETILQAGYRAGLEQGLAQAAATSQAVTVAIGNFWQEREAELSELALAIAYRVLASLPCHETAVQLALAAIADHSRSTKLALRLAPEAAAALRKALAGAGDSQRVTVTADPAMAAGECTLLHPRGRTDVGVLAQFRAVMDTMTYEGSATMAAQ